MKRKYIDLFRGAGFFLLLLIAIPGAHALAPVEVVALFKDRAVVRTAHGQTMLKVGETSEFGVRLIAADPHRAEVRYMDKNHVLTLSSKVASSFSKPTQQVVRMNEDRLGQYRMGGTINGQYVNFLVDTGASGVAMSGRQARSMGLNLAGARQGSVQTAQGTTQAMFLNLAEVAVGSITVSNVQATVIDGDYPADVLLGMSFLTKVSMQNDGGVLVLTARQ